MTRFGVVGTGWITEEFIKAANLDQRFQLTAVHSRNQARASEFAKKYSAEHIFTDLEKMAKSKTVDAVYIASPNCCHARQAILFMNHQKHVLCEKPIASNVKELLAMIEASKANQVTLMEALKTTFLPNFDAIRENLPKIGRIRRIFTSKCQYSSRYDAFKEGKTPNAFDPKLSNGSLMDIGVYCIYPVVALLGKPDSIEANAVFLESGVDGEGNLVLHYPDKEAVIIHSKITDSKLSSEIQGEAGNIIIDKISTPQKIEIHYRNGLTEDISREQSEALMSYEVQEILHLIENHQIESPVNSQQLSLAVMEIMDEARKKIGLVFPADDVS
ncbi:MAG TPA: oxidoreductase [Firmicutes bacterium]|jgi:scyllo-inositol 2-dehydrogenase (NADP+)|nr:oxidoreductase [Bacillota bacterium]